MSTKELQEKLTANMREWQKIEDESVASCGKLIAETQSDFVRTILELIQADGHVHHRLEQLIIDSLESKPIALSPDDLAAVWSTLENHTELENRTIELAHEALAALKGKKMGVQEYLIKFLLEDERKHVVMLENLEHLKSGMYPYG